MNTRRRNRRDSSNDQGKLHSGQQMAEEALLGALESRQRCRLGGPAGPVLTQDDAGGLGGSSMSWRIT